MRTATSVLTTTSADGTTIAFDRVGDGPVIVLSPGALCDRTSFAGVADVLASSFTVVNYDRRGRGDSGDTEPYAIERKVEDLAAVIAANGGAATNVVGHSSGAMLGLEAAAAGHPMAGLVAYEPPYVSRFNPALIGEVRAHVADGRPDLAVEAFILETGMPAEFLPLARQLPMWPTMLACASTLWHDLTILGDGEVPVERMSRIAVPTLVVDGGESAEEMHVGAMTLAGVVPRARMLTVAGQGHDIALDVLAGVLADDFA